MGVFGMSANILIREMLESDAPIITSAFADQGWNKPLSQYRPSRTGVPPVFAARTVRYWQESTQGQRLILLAQHAGEFAGYLTIVWESHYPPFREAGIPEIVDFNVLIKFRCLKIGTALMDAAKERILLRSPLAGIGVCSHVDYGAAQVLYARRGYIPDGRGVFYHDHYPQYGEQVTIDDDLVLHLTRQL